MGMTTTRATRVPRRRHHQVGVTPEGAAVFEECGPPRDDGKRRLTFCRPPREGEAVPLGMKATVLTPDGDGHVYLEDVDTSGQGPVQVATPAYRDGWEATFGKRGDVN